MSYKSKHIKSVWEGKEGKAFAIFLKDGTKITVGRTKDTKGPAWLEIGKAEILVAMESKT